MPNLSVVLRVPYSAESATPGAFETGFEIEQPFGDFKNAPKKPLSGLSQKSLDVFVVVPEWCYREPSVKNWISDKIVRK